MFSVLLEAEVGRGDGTPKAGRKTRISAQCEWVPIPSQLQQGILSRITQRDTHRAAPLPFTCLAWVSSVESFAVASPLGSESLACMRFTSSFFVPFPTMAFPSMKKENKVEETQVLSDHPAVNSAMNISSVFSGTVAVCSQTSICS